jgi:regulator of sigma E protease
MFSVVVFILVLSFLVIIHELGHFFAARWAGVKVEEFGIGYPPKAKKLFRWLGTDFTINWIPFGGFVRMAGEEVDPAKADQKPKAGEFYSASIFQRLVIVLAGATVNFIFGILAFASIFSLMGIPETITEARVGGVAENSPAATAGVPEDVNITGFKVGEEFTTTNTPEDVINFVADHRGQTVLVITSGKCQQLACPESYTEYSVYLRTVEETPADQGSLGVAFQDVILVKYPWWQMPFKGMVYGLEQALMLGKEILTALSSLGTNLVQKGKLSDELAGPVGIVHQAQTIGLMEQGFMVILSFAAMLSINLAIMNVLPISPLDGGKAVFTLLEALFARKSLQKIEYWFSYGGYIALMGLIVVITVRDIYRLFI